MTKTGKQAIPRARKRAKAAHAPPVSTLVEPQGIDFPVIGIGCSAGGLDALDSFFSHVPPDSGMAFVVVQHLTPNQPSALPELLQRSTRMVVTEAGEGMKTKPNCVYVIPPGKDLSLLHGVLHLLEPVQARGLRLPIDFFLRTLAQDQQKRAVGVILSGMGSDGVLGLRAIKEKDGLVVVQEPASANSDSMPRSAIKAGVADIVVPPEEMPARIAAYLRHPAQTWSEEASSKAIIPSDLDKIVVLLRDRSGNDFSLYKTNTLVRRTERRIALHQISGISDYVRFLRENPPEVDLLCRELLIGVTNFFRDADVWEHLRSVAIPAMLARFPAGKAFRAWVPACSSGEEAYSLAIVFKEAIDLVRPDGRFQLQIYGTDLDPEAIEKARKGVYPANIASDVSPQRLARYFVEDGGVFRIKKEIREMVVFAPQNIISDPPFTKLDILCCRNLLIYFRAELQKKLLPLFHYALNPEGLLLLGSAESIGGFDRLFVAENSKARLFRRIEHTLPLTALPFPSKASSAAVPATDFSHADPDENVGRLTDQIILQNHSPAAVLVNAGGDILYISGRTGKYLEPAAGKVNINIHAMAREGLRESLPGVIRKALQDRQPIHLNQLRIDTGGGTQLVNITVQAIDKPEALRGRVLIIFNDVAAPPLRGRSRKSVASSTHEALLRELEQTREALQVTHEETQTSIEELKSSNEELQSTNEELQSTNEELTTSKEEMQSMNEEIQTVNAELQSKVDDLNSIRNDMANLLNSTEIATIFLDSEMMLRRFTPHATDLFKLIPGDVGRPLSHIVTDLDYQTLKDDAEEVLRSLVYQEKQVGTNDGRWYRVRIMPYRTQDNVIDGVVITFIDISEIRKLQEELRGARQYAARKAGR
ncbi:MAG: chemotaxis protein CheB [Georgfuchsia sp.]